MDNKSFSIISYITFIGWFLAYYGGIKTADDLLKYHLKQSLGLFIYSLAFSLVLRILQTLGLYITILEVFNVFFFALIVIGIINATNLKKKPIPLIGRTFENRFSFLD